MIRPSARVYIEIRETGEVIELEDFTTISTNLSLYGTSTATLLVENKNDKWYTFQSSPDKHNTGVINQLRKVYKSPRIKDINQKIGNLTQTAYQIADPVQRQFALDQIAIIEEFLVFDLMYRIWIDFRGRDGLYDLNEPPNPKNLTERWYAGFTGIITSIDEKFAVEDNRVDESITLNCKDMRRFFEVSLITTDKGFDPLWQLVADKVASLQPLTNGFSEFIDGASIIFSLADIVNTIFHPGDGNGLYNGKAFWTMPTLIQNTQAVSAAQAAVESAQAQLSSLEAQASATAAQAASTNDPADIAAAGAAAQAAANAKAQLNTATQQAAIASGVGKSVVQRNYEDLNISPLRDVNGFAGMSKNAGFFNQSVFNPTIDGLNGVKFVKSDLIKWIKKSDIDSILQGPNANKISDYLTSLYVVDKLIDAGNGTSGLSTNPYQMLIQGMFNYESQRLPAASILSQVANYMGYNVWFDAKGNLIYQTARYDDFPNPQVDANGQEGDYDDPESSRGIPFLTSDYDTDGNVFGTYGDSGESQAPLGLRYHGRNYIIGDESVLGWSVSRDEEDVVTALAIPGNFDFVTLEQFLQKQAAIGKQHFPDLDRKFGPRLQMAPPINTKGFNTDLLDTIADGLLRKMNANLENVTLTLNWRPDLQMGRTLYFVERRKLYYITRIQQRYTQGGKPQTIVTGQYGHLATEPIGDPFRVVFENTIPPPPDPEHDLFESSQALDSQVPSVDKMQ